MYFLYFTQHFALINWTNSNACHKWVQRRRRLKTMMNSNPSISGDLYMSHRTQLYPRSTESGFTPMSVRPSVRPSVCRQGFRNFLKKLLAQFISYLAFTLMGWVSWPLDIFVFLASFSALWWPNIWPKMRFPELFEKNYWLYSFHTWHLSLWGEPLDPYTSWHGVPSLISGPLVAK